MSKKITVLLVEPQKAPRVIEIDNELESMQKTVGGLIEIYEPYRDSVAIVCNEEGKINGSKRNRYIRDKKGEILDIMAGTFFLCGVKEDDPDLLSLSSAQIARYTKEFSHSKSYVNEEDIDRALYDTLVFGYPSGGSNGY